MNRRNAQKSTVFYNPCKNYYKKFPSVDKVHGRNKSVQINNKMICITGTSYSVSQKCIVETLHFNNHFAKATRVRKKNALFSLLYFGILHRFFEMEGDNV